MLTHDPIPWVMVQEGLSAVRARRLLDLGKREDESVIAALRLQLERDQQADGSFEHSTMKTAGMLNLLDDLKAAGCRELIGAGTSYLMSVLEAQPGTGRAKDVAPGSLRNPCDLCGYFGPYEARNRPDVLARGAREMNFYREHEPLMGPNTPVRGVRESSLDRPGASSCYAWGLIPLCYTVEALCRAGHAHDARLQPAINVLLGAQRESGGWCRNLGGHPSCTIHAIRALGSHPELKRSEHAERALELMRTTQRGALGHGLARWWRGSKLFAAMQAVAAYELPIAREIIRDALEALAPRQRRNGTFGGPFRVERVVAALVAARAIRAAER